MCAPWGRDPLTNPDVSGNFTTDGHNFIGNVGFSTGFTNNVSGDQVGTSSSPKNAQLDPAGLQNNGGPADTHALLSTSTAINAGDDALAPPTDQRGYLRNGISDIGAFEFGGLIPSSLANISTRLRVETGDNVLDRRLYCGPERSRKEDHRARNRTFLAFCRQTSDPILELHDSAGALLEANDNWGDSPNRQAIIDSTIPPTDPLESAIVRSVAPGNYTAIVHGVNNGTGIAVVQAYDLDTSANSKLANISTGLGSNRRQRLVCGHDHSRTGFAKSDYPRARSSTGVPGALADPTLELRDVNGTLIDANDNWVDSPNKQAIIDSTVPPTNDVESAIVATLPSNGAHYTAIVRGVNNSTGVAVVEVTRCINGVLPAGARDST